MMVKVTSLLQQIFSFSRLFFRQLGDGKCNFTGMALKKRCFLLFEPTRSLRRTFSKG